MHNKENNKGYKKHLDDSEDDEHLLSEVEELIGEEESLKAVGSGLSKDICTNSISQKYILRYISNHIYSKARELLEKDRDEGIYDKTAYTNFLNDVLITIVTDPKLFHTFETESQIKLDRKKNREELEVKQVDGLEGSSQFWEYFLAQFTVNINGKDNMRETALYKASALGLHRSCLKLLIAGADPEITNNEGKTPLASAASAGHSDACKVLLGFSLNREFDSTDMKKSSSLKSNTVVTVENIKEYGANPNHYDLSHTTPLGHAAFGNHSKVTKVLLAHPDIKFGFSPLMVAAYLGHNDIIELLLAAGCDRYIVSSNRKTALELATENGHHRIARRLTTYKASDNDGTPNKMRMQTSARSTNIQQNNATEFINSLQLPTPVYIAPNLTRDEKNKPICTPDWADNSLYKSERTQPYFSERTNTDTMSFISVGKEDLQQEFDQNDEIDSPTTVSNSISASSEAELVRSQHSSFKKKVGSLGRMHKLRDIKIEDSEKDSNHLPFSNLSANNSKNEDDVKSRFCLDSQSWWELFSKVVTVCCLSSMLSCIGKMKDKSIQQAWREKVALCFIIFMISAGLGFLTFGFSSLVCQKVIPIFPDAVAHDYGMRSTGQKLMIVRGMLYDTGSYFPVGDHRPILPFLDEDLAPTIEPFYGQDISKFFPPDRRGSQCQFWPSDDDDPCKQLGEDPKYHCHTSAESWTQLKKLSIHNYVAFSWQNISTPISGEKYFVFNEKVYRLTDYLDSSNNDRYFGEDLNSILNNFVGRDATKDILRSPRLTNLVPCFEDQLLVGKLDGTTIGCFASNLIMLVATAVLLTITCVKFAAAMAFDWFLSWKLGKLSTKLRPKDSLSYILLLVTCYSEGEDSLRTTLDSLALTDYDDQHKLLFVIADGDITGSGNPKSTPDLLLDMLEPYDAPDGAGYKKPKPKAYIAIGDDSKQINMAKVHMGYYKIEGRRVPYMLVIKCGTPEELKKPKAGNRGKRDSQLILMRWLSNICFNEPMSPLDFDLFEKVHTLLNVTPDKFEMVLMVDADTKVLPDSVSRMVAAMERDPSIMGLCGETKITNKSDTWVTMIQVYEYYISHHLGKAFESIFGGVTCLPGCFCMYRIKAPKQDGYYIPILANPDIVLNYSSNDVSTLHKKNLLLLGEDRYLTTLMLRAFPKRKMVYVPKAICKTVVPDEFSVLLSQRRRWINSTIHNLLELVLVPQLCGIFCCSMQFVIVLELLGTVVMPASLLFLGYLIVGAFLGQDVLLPLLFMAALFVLQSILILLTTRKVVYIAWMLIFILAMPVWNLILPAYAFWNFDDFSWGATRKINGPDDGHGTGSNNEKSGPTSVTMKRWSEWHQYTLNKKMKKKMQKQRKVEVQQEQNRISIQQALADKRRDFFQHHQEQEAKIRAYQQAETVNTTSLNKFNLSEPLVPPKVPITKVEENKNNHPNNCLHPTVPVNANPYIHNSPLLNPNRINNQYSNSDCLSRTITDASNPFSDSIEVQSEFNDVPSRPPRRLSKGQLFDINDLSLNNLNRTKTQPSFNPPIVITIKQTRPRNVPIQQHAHHHYNPKIPLPYKLHPTQVNSQPILETSSTTATANMIHLPSTRTQPNVAGPRLDPRASSATNNTAFLDHNKETNSSFKSVPMGPRVDSMSQNSQYTTTDLTKDSTLFNLSNLGISGFQSGDRILRSNTVKSTDMKGPRDLPDI